MILSSSADFFQNYFFQKILSGTLSECQKVWIHLHSVGPDLGPKLFAKVISRRHKMPFARKELNAQYCHWTLKVCFYSSVVECLPVDPAPSV